MTERRAQEFSMPQTFPHLSHGAAARPLPAARMGLLLWLLGLPGVLALAWNQPPAWLAGSSEPLTRWALTAGLGLLLALAVALGIRLGPGLGLSAPLIHALAEGRMPWRGVRVLSLPGVAGGVIGAAWLVTLAVVWPESMPFVDPVYGLPLWPKLLYGAITEELLLRLGMLSTVMWLLWRVFGSPRRRPDWRLGWLAIALAALLSGCFPVFLNWTVAGDLPVPVVLQLLMCESVYGLLAGIMFWRYGLEAAMLAHVVTYLLSHGLI